MQAGGLVVSHHNSSHPLTSHTSNPLRLKPVTQELIALPIVVERMAWSSLN